MIDDLVSVIVPSYNYEKYIIECLQSIANQDYRNIELIIVDDFSKDNSRNLIKEFIKQYSENKRFIQIKYIENIQNEGAHYTINKGIQQAKGKYIAVINADDLYESNRFSAIIPKMKEKDVNIAFSSVEVIDGKSIIAQGEEAQNFRDIQIRINECGQVSHALMIQNVAISTGNMVFTKELYNRLIGFEKYKYIHDWDFILRAALIQEPLYLEETKYYYRLHNDNSFRELGDIADQEVNLVLSNFFNQIKAKNVTNQNLSKDSVELFIKNTYLYKYWTNDNLLKIILKKIMKKLGS
ncbi:UDP-Glc:alpha-D-GlcNAc-diphosphoundecaprenol beta-1,3-glucosyltransferase WfgD [Clostridium puniceum]|uniref:UDP-Glc:alpha-D-GlcNAc-diphosphoundecaprenol beta-1,3-glucosyltransferase WfgD n=1 Tax=Clostridium puniceum TaxID=29367 RepID=A0A1S8TEU3_9CLOT|nr:glycosyltransferase [Clostridium puniceum]OOM76327.1 UDP-Glc:alpha-D-GlcNAc-diphosphoundecaprenol beta-1,3-glucosyltransferase WfgD [Clostridium puniceum]